MKNLIDNIRGWCQTRGRSILLWYGIPENLLSRLIGSYFFVSVIQLLLAGRQELNALGTWKEYVAEFQLPTKIMWVASCFMVLSLVHFFVPKKYRFIDHIALIAGALAFSLCLVWRSGNYYLGIASAAVAVVFTVYAVGKLRQESYEWLPDLPAGIIVFAIAVLIMIFVAVTTVAHHLTFGTYAFDMGIFVQMFYSLKEHLTAFTTCERDAAMSHFQIHASYIYYLFVPIYALFPKGETLLVLQAIFSTGCVVPFFFLARKRGFKGFPLVCVSLVCVFYAGLIMPCYYSFHENAFLPTILMLLLYAMDQRKIVMFYIMAVLTCIVKEDAPMYVICIALFFFFEEKSRKRLHGLLITVLTGIYFVIVMKYLNTYGDGEFMTSTRFGILTIDPEDGLGGVVRNVLVNPGFFYSLLVQEGTFLFFLQTLLPLLFLPFMTKKIYRFLLIVPYVIMNLVIGAGYGYAANLGFQYIFGPSCLLLYMMLRNVEEMQQERRNLMVTASAVVTVVTTVTLASGSLSHLDYYKNNREHFRDAKVCVESVPEDASVMSNTFLLPHAANRDEIYEYDLRRFEKDAEGNCVRFIDLEEYDFFVLSRYDPNTEVVIPFLEEAGYTVYAESDNFILIYVSPQYLASH